MEIEVREVNVPETPSGNRLRELRRERGLSMEELGAKAGVHFTTIAKIERSMRKLSGEMLHKLATALGVGPAELFDEAPGTLPVRMVPIVGAIAAGNWREAVADPIGHVPVAMGGPNAFALRPEGTSMNMVVPEGALIIVDPDDRDLRDGRLYAVMNGDGESTFKRFRQDPPRLEPVSTDPEHKPIPLMHEPYTTIGRIVGQLSPL